MSATRLKAIVLKIMLITVILSFTLFSFKFVQGIKNNSESVSQVMEYLYVVLIEGGPTSRPPVPVAIPEPASQSKTAIPENKTLSAISNESAWKPSDWISLIGTLCQFIIGLVGSYVTYKVAKRAPAEKP